MRLAYLPSLLILVAAPAFATDVDLTHSGSSGTIGDARFETSDLRSTGTGVIEPFLREQNTPVEKGFNSDNVSGPDMADVKVGHWTHSVPVRNLAESDFGFGRVISLFLDVNQSGSAPLVSLDELRIYAAPSPSLNTSADLGASNLIYDMGAGNRVLLNGNLTTGSGSGDMTCFLPASLFDAYDGQYFYLYAKFGASGGTYATNGGFEEWSALLKKPH